ncbi:bifunctional enoyl-CoA hydratase/phosphate acetyltransferase [Roseococcus sp. YIM B11640]|uniref:bifunctional enoyl-CoA hydratase/phosphate acetyltransferase n=1 Tax=Roseococcus sp. YIM B11640 TaxID=3133973 RepID=UPI003C7D319E
MDGSDLLCGRPAEELHPGLRVSTTRRLALHHLDLAAALVGVPATAINGPGVSTDTALLLEAMLSQLAAQELPGPGGALLGIQLTLQAAPELEEELTATLEVLAVNRESGSVLLAAGITGHGGRILAHGNLTARPPATLVEVPRPERPAILLQQHRHMDALLARAAALPPMTTAVAWPCDHDSLLGPLEAARLGIMQPVLVGRADAIDAAATAAGASLGGIEIVEAATPQDAARLAVSLVREGRADAVMKGSLHTDELMAAVVARDTGLRGARRVSHVFLIDVPSYPKPLLVTDAAINIAPDLMAKADILQNAIEFAQALGIARPKAAILAAVETVNVKMQATMDAAMLCKMADRGQVRGAIVDGPLAFDNAISLAAARIKQIGSPVAGDPDILLCPDLEAGNMVAKQLAYLAHAEAAGLVLGARAPVILTSRSDSAAARVASAAMASIFAQSLKGGRGA